MAKLAISVEALLHALFRDSLGIEGLQITGAGFDVANQNVVLDMVGPQIPEAENVQAIISTYCATVRFEAAR
jgi:hypothetical protein